MKNKSVSSAFTIIELLAIIAVVALLALTQLPALARVTRQSKVAQCADNLRQFSLAVHVYGNESNDNLPRNSGGNWAWDLEWNVGLRLNRSGAPWQVMYCPGTAPRFTDADNNALYNFAGGSYHITGYANTFAPAPPGVGVVQLTNQNSTLTPQSQQVGLVTLPPAIPSGRVLLADATISVNNGTGTASGSFTDVVGGYPRNHTSPHLDGNLPDGVNLAMLDGHVEWRKFPDMRIRTTSGPYFWW